MAKPVVWSPASERDLNSILDYLSKNWDVNVTQKFIEVTEGIIDQISRNPKQFPVIHKKLKVRKCVITKHNTLFYREMEKQVDILRI